MVNSGSTGHHETIHLLYEEGSCELNEQATYNMYSCHRIVIHSVQRGQETEHRERKQPSLKMGYQDQRES